MKISVIGTGYVGLVSGTCFAEIGHEVLCIDNDPKKLEILKKAQIPIFEPGLDALVAKNFAEKRLNFSDSLEQAVEFAEVIFLCLPTPPNQDGSADLSYVIGVAREIAKIATKSTVVVTKSTVPVGTGDQIRGIFDDFNKEFLSVASNPEFLREGKAIEDFMNPDRIVIGAENNHADKLLREVYMPLINRGAVFLSTSLRSSELIKYAANSFLATKISFINEIANLCEKVGADIQEVSKGVGLDQRIGKRFLNAGIGYGGSCFPKDVLALHTTGMQYQENLSILDIVMKVNDYQRERFVKRVLERFDYDLRGQKIAVLGLAFKADTDDVRKTPAVEIIQTLQENGAKVVAYDPEAMENFLKYSGVKVECASSSMEAIEGAEALLVLTEWLEFVNLDFAQVAQKLNQKIVFDGRNLYNPTDMVKLGFEYYSVGRS